MLQHIVMFKIKESYESRSKKVLISELKSELEKLPEIIPEIIGFEVGNNISQSENAYDLVLLSEFENEDKLQSYRIHPAHMNVVEYLKKICEKTTVVDYYN